MPQAEPGQKIGLFGGSFNPPHQGHIHACQQAMRKLDLCQVWWLVTPGNPLKNLSDLEPLEKRIAACEALAINPRIKITAFEKNLPSRFTIDTLTHIARRNPRVDFVWIMGADNLGPFHLWRHWRAIAELMPIAVIDRPGSTLSLHSAMTAQTLRSYRIDENDASLLPGSKTPAWVFLHGSRNTLSSTALRALKK